jgi:hypothetical protein
LCSDEDTCTYFASWENKTIRSSDCGACPYGDYGRAPEELTFNHVCVPSCNGTPGGGDGTGKAPCEFDRDVPYRCEPENDAGYERYGLVMQAWNTAADYEAWNPARKLANWVGYDDQMEHGGVDGFCPGWYFEEWSGWVNIPGGFGEFDIAVDKDYGCCMSGCSDRCDRCDDHNGGSWVHFAFLGAGTAADPWRPNPAGGITPGNQSGYPTGLNVGLSSDDVISGYFAPGGDNWYFLRGHYMKGDDCRDAEFVLRYRSDPADNWGDGNNVPSSWYRPCGPLDTGDVPVCTMTQPPEASTYNVGQTISVEATATDVDGDLTRMNLYTRFSDDDGVTWGDWVYGTAKTCSGSNCSHSVSRTLSDVGTYQAVCDANDPYQWCSGNPDRPWPPGLAVTDCDGVVECTAATDCTQFTVGNPPQCRQNSTYAMRYDDTTSTWVNTTEYIKSSDPIAIKMSAYDTDREDTLDAVSASCTSAIGNISTRNTFINSSGSRLRIRAYGTNYPSASNGVWPQMNVWFRSSTGARINYGSCNFVVDSNSWADYTCDLAGGAPYHSYFMIEFANDGGDGVSYDKNLFIDYVLYFPNRNDATNVITLQGEHVQNIYEIGSSNIDWDGMDIMNFDSAADVAARPWVTRSGRAGMYYGGVLKFPVLWMAPTTVGQSCTVTLNPASSGNTCTQAITSTAFSITGNLKVNDAEDPVCNGTPVGSNIDTVAGSTVSFYEPPSTALVSSANVNVGLGTYTIADSFFGNQEFNSFAATLADNDPLVDYEMYCVQASSPAGTSFYNSSLNIATAAPPYAMNYNDINVDFLYKELGNEKWFQANNGDIYSGTFISVDIPDFKDDTDGSLFAAAKFFPSLVYRYDDVAADDTAIYPSIGGNVYLAKDGLPNIGVGSGSKVEYAEPHPDSGDFDRGVAHNLDDDSTALVVESNSQWIKDFSFEPPARFDSASSTINNLVLNEVYYVTESAFTNYINNNSGSYTLNNDSDGRSEGVTIVYIQGNPGDELDIDPDITNSQGPDTKKSLILVYPGRILFTENVGHDFDDVVAAGYTERGSSTGNIIPNNIEAVILSGEGIESYTVDGGDSTRDKILVVQGMLIAGNGGDGNVALNRSLGRNGNSEYPAEIVRYNQYVMYYLTILERDLSLGASFTGLGESYTGLDDFGVEFIYED